MTADVTSYTDLITSEYANQPNFIATIMNTCQPLADSIACMEALPGLFDLDVAVGDQLNIVGQWIGPTRQLSIPLTNVFFSFDIAGLGFDQADWEGPFNPNGQLITLSDITYRLLLQVTAAANQWDGTIPGIYDTWGILFSETPGAVRIADTQNGAMQYEFVGVPLDAVTKALLSSGVLLLRPMGINANITFF